MAYLTKHEATHSFPKLSGHWHKYSCINIIIIIIITTIIIVCKISVSNCMNNTLFYVRYRRPGGYPEISLLQKKKKK